MKVYTVNSVCVREKREGEEEVIIMTCVTTDLCPVIIVLIIITLLIFNYLHTPLAAVLNLLLCSSILRSSF